MSHANPESIKALVTAFAAAHSATVTQPYERDTYFVVTLADGTRVDFSGGYWTKDKTCVSSNPGEHRHRRYDEKAPSINVNPERPVGAVIADINRRLLEAAREDCARARAYRAAEDAYENAVEANMRRLGFYYPANGIKTICGPHLPGSRYMREINVSEDSVSFHISGMTVEQAERILAILKEQP